VESIQLWLPEDGLYSTWPAVAMEFGHVLDVKIEDNVIQDITKVTKSRNDGLHFTIEGTRLGCSLPQ
jgi:hypothetical protein